MMDKDALEKRKAALEKECEVLKEKFHLTRGALSEVIYHLEKLAPEEPKNET